MSKTSRILNYAKRCLKPLGIATTASFMLSQQDRIFGVSKTSKIARFCGIIGYLGKEANAFQIVSEGISLLENRGYDSAGIGSIINGNIEIEKFATLKKEGDCIERLLLDERIQKKFSGCHLALGHTRWATCGGIEDYNAHPHSDSDGQLTLIHNGTILNHRVLKEELIKKGVEFQSQTDTEVIAQLIGQELKAGKTPVEAIEATLEQIVGNWGLAIIFKNEPERIYCSQNGSHLVIGIGNEEIFLASESRAFQKYTRNIVELQDGELAILGKNEEGEYTIINKELTSVNTPKKERLAKGGFNTFFEKEIFEQKEAAYNAIGKASRICTNTFSTILGGLFEAKEQLNGIESIYFFGCGSSFFACQYSSYFFKIMQTFDNIQVLEASNVEDHDLPNKNCLGIFVSQSGETKDLHRVLRMFKKKGFPTFGIVNVVGSLIAKETDYGCYMNAGPENSVPSTKSFLASMICQILVALWFSHERNNGRFFQMRQKICFSLLALSCFIGNMFNKKTETKLRAIATGLVDVRHILILAKGVCMPMAREAALKLKETSYIHAEAIGAGDLKHGPIALIDSNDSTHLRIILFIMEDSKLEEMELALEEVKARNGYTIVITDCLAKLDPKNIDEVIEVPHLDYLAGILTIIPIQLICLYLAELKGINPDKPRNLAKCVTVL